MATHIAVNLFPRWRTTTSGCTTGSLAIPAVPRTRRVDLERNPERLLAGTTESVLQGSFPFAFCLVTIFLADPGPAGIDLKRNLDSMVAFLAVGVVHDPRWPGLAPFPFPDLPTVLAPNGLAVALLGKKLLITLGPDKTSAAVFTGQRFSCGH